MNFGNVSCIINLVEASKYVHDHTAQLKTLIKVHPLERFSLLIKNWKITFFKNEQIFTSLVISLINRNCLWFHFSLSRSPSIRAPTTTHINFEVAYEQNFYYVNKLWSDLNLMALEKQTVGLRVWRWNMLESKQIVTKCQRILAEETHLHALGGCSWIKSQERKLKKKSDELFKNSRNKFEFLHVTQLTNHSATYWHTSWIATFLLL